METLSKFLLAVFVLSVSSTQPCQKFSQYAAEVECRDLNLSEFPDFTGLKAASAYQLSGNSFSHLTSSTFPPTLIKEIRILRNDYPLLVDENAFQHISSSLAVLKLQNVEFQFDSIFRPVVGLKNLNSLEIGSRGFARNLTIPFLDAETMDRLIWLRVVHSGVVDVEPGALDSDFRRLRHLGFSHNRLQIVPQGIQQIMAQEQTRRHAFEVDLSYNLLETVSPDWFPPGCSVTLLDLSYNKISSVRLGALDNCPRLNRLVLSGNADLLYLSPALFPNNCRQTPGLEIHLQHSGIRNVEFALRSCVSSVIFWNASVPCTCRHMSLLNCSEEASPRLYGECLWKNGDRLLLSEARDHWQREGCFFPEGNQAYAPEPKPDAGDPLAGLKDWGDCKIETTSTSTTSTTTTTTTTTTTATTTTASTTADSTTSTVPSKGLDENNAIDASKTRNASVPLITRRNNTAAVFDPLLQPGAPFGNKSSAELAAPSAHDVEPPEEAKETQLTPLGFETPGNSNWSDVEALGQDSSYVTDRATHVGAPSLLLGEVTFLLWWITLAANPILQKLLSQA